MSLLPSEGMTSSRAEAVATCFVGDEAKTGSTEGQAPTGSLEAVTASSSTTGRLLSETHCGVGPVMTTSTLAETGTGPPQTTSFPTCCASIQPLAGFASTCKSRGDRAGSGCLHVFVCWRRRVAVRRPGVGLVWPGSRLRRSRRGCRPYLRREGQHLARRHSQRCPHRPLRSPGGRRTGHRCCRGSLGQCRLRRRQRHRLGRRRTGHPYRPRPNRGRDARRTGQ